MRLHETNAARPKVLLLIPHLRGGGAEQVNRLLARGLSRQKYDVLLALVAEKRVRPASVPLRVKAVALGAASAQSASLKVLRLVWRLKPDVVLSGMAQLNFLVLLLRPFFPRHTRVLIRQNPAASLMSSSEALPVYTRALYRMLWRRADRLNSRSSATARDLAYATCTRPDLVTAPPAPAETESIRMAWPKPMRGPGQGPHLIAAGRRSDENRLSNEGRFSDENGFDLLLRAFLIVRESFPAVSLTIAGAGRDEERLKDACWSLGVDKAVRFTGCLESPHPVLPGPNLFVLSSRSEGLPNELLEAAPTDMPVVAFPSSGALLDFLRDRPQTWVAERISARALAASIVEALLALRHQERSRGHNPAFAPLVSPTPAAVSTSTL